MLLEGQKERSKVCFGISQPQFFSKIVAVKFNGTRGGIQQYSDFLGCLAIFDQASNLNFSWGKIEIFGGQLV